MFAERNNKQEALTLQLGNLLPGQHATVEIDMCAPLKITGSAYEFAIPLSFMPQYKTHSLVGAQEKTGFFAKNPNSIVAPYTYEFTFDIVDWRKIGLISAPEKSKTEKIDTGYRVRLGPVSEPPKSEIKICYRPDGMGVPELRYRKQGDEVAWMMAFVPTFEPKQPQDADPCLTSSEEPESSVLSRGKDFAFIFLVDRSGSMMGDRIETTKTALKLFIQSLPVGSTFAILGFGSESYWVTQSNKDKVSHKNYNKYGSYEEAL